MAPFIVHANITTRTASCGMAPRHRDAQASGSQCLVCVVWFAKGECD